MEDFVILHIEGKKSIKHKRDNESIVEEIKKWCRSILQGIR